MLLDFHSKETQNLNHIYVMFDEILLRENFLFSKCYSSTNYLDLDLISFKSPIHPLP